MRSRSEQRELKSEDLNEEAIVGYKDLAWSRASDE